MQDRFQELFAEWENIYNADLAEGKVFVRDGIVDEALWQKAEKKVLYILKERNEYKNKAAEALSDFRQALRTKPWLRLGYWSYGLNNTTAEGIPPFSEAQKNAEYYCKMSAVINLKKLAGNASSDMKEIEKYAREDLKLINRQIDLISPDIIVCGGTFRICKTLFELDEMAPRVYKSSKYTDAVWIDCVHPSKPFTRNDLLYGDITSAYQGVL